MAKYFDNKAHTQPIVSPLTNEFMNIGRSRHNLNYKQAFKGIFGLLMPFDIIPAFPNTDIKVGYDCLFEVTNPLKKKIFNNVTAYIHTFKVLFNDTWEGFGTHIQHGQDGDIVLNAPKLITRLAVSTTNVGVKTASKAIVIDTKSLYSPSSYFGLPASRFDKSVTSGRQNKLQNNLKPQITSVGTDIASALTEYSAKLTDTVDVKEYPTDFPLNALYWVGFVQIFKSKYLNHNLMTKNKLWFPDDVMHFILPYNCPYVDQLNYNFSITSNNLWDQSTRHVYLGSSATGSDVKDYIKWFFDFNNCNSPYWDSTLTSSSTVEDNGRVMASSPWLNIPRFRQWQGDYFISSSPFANLMRGVAPQINITDLLGSIDWSNVLGFSTDSNNPTITSGYYSSSDDDFLLLRPINTSTDSDERTSYLKKALDKAIVNVSGRIPLSLQQFREVTAYSLMLERSAKTDGTYNSIVKAQFGVSPKVNQHEPFYIGGANFSIVSSEVLQTSESSGSSPLGSQAGRLIGAGSAYIGDTHFEDFGFVMSVMSIVPENFYADGVERWLTDISPDDVYFPLLNNLSADAIKNMELFISNSKSTNEDIFSWKQRFDQYRSRRNKVKNDFVLDHSIDDESASRVFMRRFSSMPQFNNSFVTMTPDSVDMEIFQNAYEAPFDVSVGCRCDWVGPLPSDSNPATFGFLNIK